MKSAKNFRFFQKGKKRPSSTLSNGLRTTAYPRPQVLSTTVWRGSFCLLCFDPWPVRFSLTNLKNLDSPVFPMLTPNLAWTPDLHRTPAPRNPTFKPFRDPSLQVAGLQACATIPGYSRLPITRTLANSNLALTRTKIDFPWISVIHSL